jgi:branched-chain amino acid transport system permease protein
MTDEMAQALVGALVLGSLYTVVGIGFVILYKATHFLNFAQGSLMLLGGLIFYSVNQSLGVPWPLAIPISLVAMAIIGGLLYQLFFTRLVGSAEFTLVIATLGLSTLVLTVALIIWGPGTRTLPELLSRDTLFSVGNVHLSSVDVFSIASAVVVVVVLDLALRHTRLGVRMRAVADEPLLASLMKINVNRMSALAWAVAALCAGVAGICYSMRLSIDPVALSGLGLLAFPAVLLGGLDSVRGVLAGGFLLAIVQNAASLYIGGVWTDVTAYAVMLVVLLVRPRGFFGSRLAVRL